MEFSRGWGINDFDLARLRLIDYLADQEPSAIPALPDWAQDRDSVEYRHATDAMRELADYGFLDNYSIDFDGGVNGMLNAHGRSLWRQIDQRRSDGRLRGREVRDALLHWLEEQYRTGNQFPIMDQFAESSYSTWYGKPFPTDEVERASGWLKNNGFIDGITSANAVGVVRANITEKGLAIVENDRSVNDPEPRSTGDFNLTINQSGDYAVAQAGGHGSAQNFTHNVIEDHQEQILGFANALDELLQAKSLTDGASLPAQIREATQKRDPGSLGRILTGTREYLEQHAATGLGALVLVKLAELMHVIGLS